MRFGFRFDLFGFSLYSYGLCSTVYGDGVNAGFGNQDRVGWGVSVGLMLVVVVRGWVGV